MKVVPINKNKDVEAQYLWVLKEVSNTITNFSPDTCELIVEYDEKHHNIDMQMTIIDVMKIYLEMFKQMNLEDELGGQDD